MILTITAVVAGVSAKYAPGSGTAAMFVLKLHLKSFFFSLKIVAIMTG